MAAIAWLKSAIAGPWSPLREWASPALNAVRARSVTDAVERVVEATVLLSGLGFESGGLSISHAMTRGLSRVRGARDALHGYQVAYALLVQLVLEGRDDAFLADVERFFRDIGLPRCLADLGLDGHSEAELVAIADGTMTAPHVKNFLRPVSGTDIAAAMRVVEQRAGR